MPSSDTLPADYPAFLSRLTYLHPFMEACPDLGFMQQAAALFPWFHKLRDPEQAFSAGGSRNLESIGSCVYEQR